ncbi:MAG: hypothetical protein MUE52_07240 [Tabrizicola sp.]|nr:hypothetical protein [Tabrizicola sp.]
MAFAALNHPDVPQGQLVLLVSNDSPNDRIYRAFASYGWCAPDPSRVPQPLAASARRTL